MSLDAATRSEFLRAVRRFVDTRLRPAEERTAVADEVPPDIVLEMRDLGLFGLSIPEQYGGLGLSMEDECLLAFELGRTSPAFRSEFGTNVGIGSQGLVIAGTEAQKRHWLPRIARGEIVASFALTEPDAGSDSGSIRTRAIRDADGWRLTGLKRYITNAAKAGLFTVMARTEEQTSGSRGISAFLVPRDTPGLDVGPPERKMGQQGARVHDVAFDEVRLGDDALLGARGRGFEIAMRVLDKGRLHIAALCVGVADRLIADSVAYAKQRRQFGRPIAEFQLVQAMLADSQTDTLAARAMVLDTARRRDGGDEVTLESAACKYFCSEMVGRVADRAVQIFGGAGYIADHGIERFYRDVRLFRIYEGTSQIQQLVIARELLKRAPA